ASGGWARASGGWAPASGGLAPASGGLAPASGGLTRQQQRDRGQRERQQRGLREDLPRLLPELSLRPLVTHRLDTGRRLAQPARGQARSRYGSALPAAESTE